MNPVAIIEKYILSYERVSGTILCYILLMKAPRIERLYGTQCVGKSLKFEALYNILHMKMTRKGSLVHNVKERATGPRLFTTYYA